MRRIISWAAFLALAGGCSVPEPDARVWVAYNQDCGNFYGWHLKHHPNEPMTRQTLAEYFDPSLASCVTHYFINPNGMTASFESDAFECDWKLHGKIECAMSSRYRTHDKIMALKRQLADDKLDPFAFFMERARERGVSPWISMRMNDVHHTWEDDNRMIARHWLAHPEMRLHPDYPIFTAMKKDSSFVAYDFEWREVRELRLRQVDELLSRYDADGIELDFMRECQLFRPGRARENVPLLTAFVREVRRMAGIVAKRRGHGFGVAVRIPSRPEAARALGMDFETWAREGLVDLVIAGNNYPSSDFGYSSAEWKRILRAANPSVRFLAGRDDGFASECRRETRRALTMAEQAGWIERHLAEGADGLYFFNICYADWNSGDMRYFKEGGWSVRRFATEGRAYPVSYIDYARFVGTPLEAPQLPVEVGGRQVDVRVACGRMPTEGTVAAVLGFSRTPSPKLRATVRLNGQAASGSAEGPSDLFVTRPEKRCGKSVWRFEFPASAMREGFNVITIGGVGQRECVLHACEMQVGGT